MLHCAIYRQPTFNFRDGLYYACNNTRSINYPIWQQEVVDAYAVYMIATGTM